MKFKALNETVNCKNIILESEEMSTSPDLTDCKNIGVSFNVSAPSSMSETEIETIIKEALSNTALVVSSYMEVHTLDESLNEDLDESDFLVGDQLEWTSLDGTDYKAQVIDVDEDSVYLDMMHRASETEENIMEKMWFEVTVDPDGKTCIVADISSNKEDAVYVYPS